MNRKVIFTALLVLGITAVCVGAILHFILSNISLAMFLKIFAMGFTFLLMGSVWLISARYHKNNPNAAKAAYINNTDERNKTAREKAGYMTFHVTSYLMMAASFVFLFMDNTAARYTVLAMLILQCVVFFTLEVYFKKRM